MEAERIRVDLLRNILKEIEQNREINQNTLWKASKIGSYVTVLKQLEKMEKMGLITREKSGNSKVIKLTEKGINFLKVLES